MSRQPRRQSWVQAKEALAAIKAQRSAAEKFEPKPKEKRVKPDPWMPTPVVRPGEEQFEYERGDSITVRDRKTGMLGTGVATDLGYVARKNAYVTRFRLRMANGQSRMMELWTQKDIVDAAKAGPVRAMNEIRNLRASDIDLLTVDGRPFNLDDAQMLGVIVPDAPGAVKRNGLNFASNFGMDPVPPGMAVEPMTATEVLRRQQEATIRAIDANIFGIPADALNADGQMFASPGRPTEPFVPDANGALDPRGLLFGTFHGPKMAYHDGQVRIDAEALEPRRIHAP